MFTDTAYAAEESPQRIAPAPALRTLLYCHDTYGLGHLRRTASLAAMLSASSRLAGAQLIVSGSPVGHRFPLPSGTDLVSLPSVVKVGPDRYASRSLPIGYASVHAMRRELILAAAQSFRPDLVIIDHAPAGLDGEALPALQDLWRNSPKARLVLGLRDVIDDPASVRSSWALQGAHALLDDLYHGIVVYGERELYDVPLEYGFSARATAKTSFVGYLGRPSPSPDRDEILSRHHLTGRRLALVTVGGGGDGGRLVETVLQAVRARRAPGDLAWLVVGGPLMPARDWEALTATLAPVPNVRLVRFLDDLPEHLRAADVVVSMGGYNSVCEILSSGRPALIVPRVHPRREQWIRARLLERRGLVRVLHPAELNADALLANIETLLAAESVCIPNAMLNGLARMEDGLVGLIGATDRAVLRQTRPAAPVGARPHRAATGLAVRP